MSSNPGSGHKLGGIQINLTKRIIVVVDDVPTAATATATFLGGQQEITSRTTTSTTMTSDVVVCHLGTSSTTRQRSLLVDPDRITEPLLESSDEHENAVDPLGHSGEDVEGHS